MWTFLLMMLAYLTLGGADDLARQYLTSSNNSIDLTEDGSSVQLNVQDPCWFYRNQDPILVCISTILDWDIYWRRDGEFIGIGGSPVGADKHLYNITSYVNGASRQENLRVSSIIVNSSMLHNSEFLCESQQYRSHVSYLEIPDCVACQACSGDSTTMDGFNTTSVSTQSHLNTQKHNTAWVVVAIVCISVLAVAVVTLIVFCTVYCYKAKYTQKCYIHENVAYDQPFGSMELLSI